MGIKDRASRAAAWVKHDPERAIKAAVLLPIIVITFAVAASHTLDVGDDRAHVTGWKAWSVAGTLEILAAYSFYRAARAHGSRRIFPGLVSAFCAFMILWINLASVEDYTWSTIKDDPWPAVFALAPAVVFLLAAALMEVEGWGRKRAPHRAPAAKKIMKTAKVEKSGERRDPPPDLGNVTDIRDADRPMVEAILADVRDGGRVPSTRAIKDRFKTGPSRAGRIQQTVKKILGGTDGGEAEDSAEVRDA